MPIVSHHRFTLSRHTLCHLLPLLLVATILSACARMGQPDGGWYDEQPPRVVGAEPAENATGVKSKKLYIYFSEYIKLTNASEKVIVSPPQMEQPEITSQGKRIAIKLADSLRANTTYTVDFSDAISDNNEDNPLGNYAYVFSTGDNIDSLEVSGTVIQANDFEPVKGILVGLYSDLADSAFTSLPMLRVARTDASGHFVIRGVAPGSYRVYALQDQDGNYSYSQKSEMMAALPDTITPSAFPDVRQDTLWRDTLHIQKISRVNYTHFMPDNLVLKAFTAPQTDRYLVKQERKDANMFSLFFSYGSDTLPVVRGLNFDSDHAFFVQSNDRRDTINYWLRDSTLINQDTLTMAVSYLKTDSMGRLMPQTDTLQVLSKIPYERRLKLEEKNRETWLKNQNRLRRRGLRYDSIMPRPALDMEWAAPSAMAPDDNVLIKFREPLLSIDTTKIHLYSKIDTSWYRSPFRLVPYNEKNQRLLMQHRVDSLDTLSSGETTFALIGEWRPGVEYSVETDSGAFCGLYGELSEAKKQGVRINRDDQYATVLMSITGFEGRHLVVDLLNSSGNVVKTAYTDNGKANFYYVKEGTYYMRMLVDDNNNGKWDTGDFNLKLAPEDVYYYPRKLECRAKWDLTETWNPRSVPLQNQKPEAITKQKAEKKKAIQQRNAERAKKLGIQYIPHM